MATAQESFHWHYSELDDRNFEIGGKTLFFIIVLFSVIIAVTLLFLYARWACRYSSVLPITNPHAPHAPPQGRDSCGLDFAVASRLPITLHRSSGGGGDDEEEEEVECCICLGIIEEGEKVKVLPTCGHCYHSECVDRWLCTRSSCPMCRAPIRLDADVTPAIVVVVTEPEQ